MSVPNIHEIAVKRRIEANRLGVGHLENSKLSVTIAKSSESEEEPVMGTVVAKYSTSPRPTAPMSYYGINIPCENQDSLISQRCLHVYTDKLEAMNVVKQHKKARFKVFKTRQEAIDFSFQANSDLVSSTASETFESRFRPSSPIVGEKPSLFKGPKAQELVKLRKSIECGDVDIVQSMIWENPRYLVSSGDTPAILQEGSRYNALHIAAKAKNALMTDLILRTVRDPKFIGLLYGDDNLVYSEDRIRILLDLYLNTPDKGLNETPLHFAVKYGASKVVDVLVSHPQCDKQPRNKYNQTPKDIVCSRVNSADAWLKDEIYALLDGHFYVPVLRSEDITVQPTVGKPFSPMCLAELNGNPKDTRVEIRAYAGPMNQQQADIFHKKLKTPPRMKQPTLNPWRLADTEKGLEREGRDLAQQLKVGWKEYWTFLDTFADFSTPEGLQVLENYLHKRFSSQDDCNFPCENNVVPESVLFKTEHIITSNGSPGCNRDTLKDNICPKSPMSPMTDLCLSLQACSLLNKSTESNTDSPKHRKQDTVYNRGEWRTKDLNGMVSQEEQVLLGMLTKPGLSPFLYVDKSCQVFGKRIADGLTHISVGEPDSNGDTTWEFLKQEMKHLQSLVNSYMDDPRFVSVDFHLVHSRIASIVRAKLSTLSQEEFDAVFDICSLIDSCQGNSHVSSDEEDFNVGASTYRNQVGMEKRKKSEAEISRIHVDCITHLIFLSLKSTTNSLQDENVANSNGEVHYQTEEGCMQIWADAIKCCCPWPTQNFVRNSRKGSSYNRMKYTTNKELSQSKNELAGRDNVRANLKSSICISDNSDSIHDTNLSLNISQCLNNCSDEEDVDSEEEAFFTPPSSPECVSEESSEDEMESPDEGDCVFIEGSTPTQIDVSVLEALEQCKLSPTEYPNIYRWRHSVLLHKTTGTSIARSALAHCCTTPNSRQLDNKVAYAFSLHENWHNVVPPSSPFSPQFKRVALNRKF